jgi:hypothetical protein
MGVDGKYLDVKISRWVFRPNSSDAGRRDQHGIGAAQDEAVDAAVDLTLQQHRADPLGQWGASQAGRQVKL